MKLYRNSNISMQSREKDKGQGESNILVAIRVRPLSNKEANSGDWDVIRVQDNLIIILDPIEKEFEAENKKMLEVLHRSKEQRYAFDKIYREENSENIYSETVKPLIKTVVNGKNATVFAYGPTGTGKTYTMLGNQDTYGLNVLAIRDIFELIREDIDYEFSVLITYVEIYNEMIRDLLIPTSGYLELRDDSDKGITIAGVTQFRAESTEQVMNLLLIGNRRRTTEATNANQTSSRSHAVFQINILKTPKTKNTNVETLSSKLSLIDLAGSQRGTVTENRGIRLMEGAKINRSLLALANCINALGDKNKKGFFVPYRDSKLTRLLKDSLGGNCKTVMIANISPASSQFQETINSLKYANRAKNIKTKALTNKKLVSIHISEYKNIINDLRTEIEQLKHKLERNTSDHPNEHDLDPIPPIVTGPRKEGSVCVCGKVEQSGEIKKIKEQVFQNFNERIQLRRALMEIEQQNSINMLDIKKKQGQIMLLTKSVQEDNEESKHNQEQIKALNRVIQTLKLSTQKNILKREITNMQLMESMTATKKIREEIPRRIRTKENREFLQIIIRNHVLELQNIELEINLQIQEKIITDLKNIAMTQRAIITEKGIDFRLDDQLLEDDNIELEIDEDSQIPEEEALDDEEDMDADLEKKLFRRNRSAHKIDTKNQDQDDDRKKEDQDRKRKNQFVENGPVLSFNGYSKKKEREKTLDNKGINGDKNGDKNGERGQNALNVNSNGNIPPIAPVVGNMLDFNLKGVNVRLNEKLPFSMAPKDKKKK